MVNWVYKRIINTSQYLVVIGYKGIREKYQMPIKKKKKNPTVRKNLGKYIEDNCEISTGSMQIAHCLSALLHEP